jgi:hypothetical protein
MANMKAVLSQLRSEKSNLEDQLKGIREALRALGSLTGGRSERIGKRTLSANARARIAAAQRARWAKWKKAKKVA